MPGNGDLLSFDEGAYNLSEEQGRLPTTPRHTRRLLRVKAENVHDFLLPVHICSFGQVLPIGRVGMSHETPMFRTGGGQQTKSWT